MGREPQAGRPDLARLDAALRRGGLALENGLERRPPFTVVDRSPARPLRLKLYLWRLLPGEDHGGRLQLQGPEDTAARRHSDPVVVLAASPRHRRRPRHPDRYALWSFAVDEPWRTSDLAVDAEEWESGPGVNWRLPFDDHGPAVLDADLLPPTLQLIADSSGGWPARRAVREAFVRRIAADDSRTFRSAADPPAQELERRYADETLFDGDALFDDEIVEGGELRHSYDGGRRASKAPPPAGAPKPPPAVVETGFAPSDRPAASLDARAPLPPDHELLFWFAIGSGRTGAIDAAPQSVPGSKPGLPLTVHLFSFDGELQPVGPSRGRIVLDERECSRVEVPAASVGYTGDPERVLYFSVRTPATVGPARLRCHVYAGGTLVQSHLVTAHVGAGPPADGPALRTDVDYHLADTIRSADLERLPGHDLSLLVNGNEATHQLRVFADLEGDAEFASDASLSAPGLETAIGHARASLRRTAWGTAEEWTDEPGTKPAGQAYRYEEPALDDLTARPLPPSVIDRLAADLIRLARDGSRLYLPLVRDLAGGPDARRELERFLTSTRRIQIASADSGMYVPAAIFYDHLLEDGVEEGYRLCADFRRALEQGTPLEALACLHDGCAERADLMSVCVSGFWGFRHDIGWPLSTKRPLTELVVADGPEVLIGISTDPQLRRRDEHVTRIGALATSSVADDRDRFAQALHDRTPTVIYLYCHGGLTSSEIPYVEIGQRGGPVITEAFWRNHGIQFDDDRRPLVFVNGCHTAALDPAHVVSLVDGFVREANAVGAIGTELTVFEPLAVAFGEAVMGAFLDDATTIGAAVRGARLRLLQQGNPLGLVYVPFVAADTRIVVGVPRNGATEDDVTAAA